MPPDMDDVYMRLPIAHTISHSGDLISLGFKASSFDPCLFSKTYPDDNFVWAAVHVDDIYVLAKTISVREAAGVFIFLNNILLLPLLPLLILCSLVHCKLHTAY